MTSPALVKKEARNTGPTSCYRRKASSYSLSYIPGNSGWAAMATWSKPPASRKWCLPNLSCAVPSWNHNWKLIKVAVELEVQGLELEVQGLELAWSCTAMSSTKIEIIYRPRMLSMCLFFFLTYC